MASLYIKDEETTRLAQELAERRHLTKTAAVRLALTNELAKDTPTRSLHEIADELRRTSTLRFDPTVVIDKAFYDSLNDEEDD
ncbi:type II toxin-antitoxin system VapB family antitoxin [Sphingomonas mollis]|uniref:Type II toxin-antitoxin system VapB family antitoxin n=1 Tax=Sphingomonas mollis TaxID=2795726 RepID=A0ABS0XKL6_9SPHN|nr:type II toxin-antitoxin system VapB family antitoxin [Sphingomonas sp. BT553]MBJ6120574.1 type II toxin-antitoxin system VapB family antitoxin [Sphingomonas sp. BT553]